VILDHAASARFAGTYSRIANDGGSSGGTMRFKEELKHEANAGLSTAVEKLEKKVKKKHKDISYADLYTLAGAVAVETMGGPQIPWRSGRVDAPSAKSVTPNGRLPDPDKGEST
jgi:cytochrome c peroxidase